MSLTFGIAGWSYEDWKGWVYPGGCRDTLQFCARYVDCIEINSTFYRLPDPNHSASWARRTEQLGTLFTAKVPRVFTHDLRVVDGDVRATREGFAPLADSGRLRALLLQFSYRLTATQEHFDHLAKLRDAFAAVAPLVVEVRHGSWSDPAALAALGDLGLSVAHLDYPGNTNGFGGTHVGPFGPEGIAYFRLHGRNHTAWFDKHADRDATYDYLYPNDEVQQLLDRLTALAAAAQQTMVVGNNHFRGQEMKVVLELMAASRGTKVDVPPLLAERYPDLDGIAKGRQRGLFG